MKMREQLADWISGGALTRAKISAQIDEENRVLWRYRASKRNREIAELNAALRGIIMHETPKANATVRRMARIAREALK